MIPIQQILVRCTEEQLESIPVTLHYSSLVITSSTGKFTA